MAKVVPCEIYSRVVGYFRPVQNWNDGKRAEYSDRQAYSESISMGHATTAHAFDGTMANTADEEPMEVIEQKQHMFESPITEQVSEVTINVNGSTNVSSSVAGYKIYTLPGCSKCVEVKSFLANRNIHGREVNLRNSEGMEDFKEFYKAYRERIKRGEDRTALLPIVVLGDSSDKIVGIAQSLEEVKSYL